MSLKIREYMLAQYQNSFLQLSLEKELPNEFEMKDYGPNSGVHHGEKEYMKIPWSISRMIACPMVNQYTKFFTIIFTSGSQEKL